MVFTSGFLGATTQQSDDLCRATWRRLLNVPTACAALLQNSLSSLSETQHAFQSLARVGVTLHLLQLVDTLADHAQRGIDFAAFALFETIRKISHTSLILSK